MLPPEGEQPTSAQRPVVLVALGILVADLVTKQIILLVFDPPRRIEVTPFLNFVPVWNPGVSFGILADAGGAVPLLLTALAIGVAAWLENTLFSGSSVLVQDSSLAARSGTR